MMSDGLGWTRAQSSTIPDGLTPILRFLHSSPASHSGADLQAAIVPLQIADLQSFGAPGDKLVSWYLPPGSVGGCTSGCIEVRERGTDCCAPYLGGSFCGMHPQHVCVCVLVIVWDGWQWALQRVRGNWNGNSIVRSPRPTSRAAFPARTRIFSTRHVSFSIRLLLPWRFVFNQICLLSFLVDQTSNWILVRRRSIVNLFLFDLSKYGSHPCVMSMSEVIMNAWEDSITIDGFLEINNILNWKKVLELFLIGRKTDRDKVVS